MNAIEILNGVNNDIGFNVIFFRKAKMLMGIVGGQSIAGELQSNGIQLTPTINGMSSLEFNEDLFILQAMQAAENFEFNATITHDARYTAAEVKAIVLSEIGELSQTVKGLGETAVIHSTVTFRSSLDDYGDYRFNTENMSFCAKDYYTRSNAFIDLSALVNKCLLHTLKGMSQ